VTDYRERLSSWLIEAGGHHEYLEIRELRGMRGVVATRPIARDRPLVQIPRSLLVNARTALERLADRQLRVTELEAAGELSQLAAWLLVEQRDASSTFQPYFDALPRSFPHVPIHASPADLALLDGSLAGAMLDHLRATLHADHAQLVAEVPWFRSFGFDDFVWARLSVVSRNFRLKMEGHDARVLVPFVDMLNHERGPNARWEYDAEGQAFRLIAQRDYRPGEEVCCDYGRKPNMYLLLHYGFCVDDNDADEAVLGATEQVRVTRSTEEPFAQLMLAQLRARCADEAEARAALAEAARAGLARFSTTLAEDRALLARNELSTDARNFVVTRLGEKRVLHAWLDFASDGPAE
jgi:SET domain/Rubisco LSMT substrate-binding